MPCSEQLRFGWWHPSPTPPPHPGQASNTGSRTAGWGRGHHHPPRCAGSRTAVGNVFQQRLTSAWAFQGGPWEPPYASVSLASRFPGLPLGQVLPVSGYLTRQARSCNNIYHRSSINSRARKAGVSSKGCGWFVRRALFLALPLTPAPGCLRLPAVAAPDNPAQSGRLGPKAFRMQLIRQICSCVLVVSSRSPPSRSRR